MTTFRHYRKIEIVASLVMWVITIGMGVYLAAMWSRIPDIVPTHYGLFGQPDEGKRVFWDRFLSKWS